MAAAPRRVAKDFCVDLSTGSWEFILDDPAGVTVHAAGVVIIKHSRNNRDRLDTFIHETLHASDPALTEEEVERIAADVTKVLWKAGYRRP